MPPQAAAAAPLAVGCGAWGHTLSTTALTHKLAGGGGGGGGGGAPSDAAAAAAAAAASMPAAGLSGGGQLAAAAVQQGPTVEEREVQCGLRPPGDLTPDAARRK